MINRILSAEDFAKYDWLAALEGCAEPLCRHYIKAFGKRRRELHVSSDDAGEAIYTLLKAASGMWLAHGDSQTVFAEHPGQLPHIEEFSDEALRSLVGLAPSIGDPELCARVADVLWLRRKGGHYTWQTGASSYLERAQRLVDAKPTASMRRFERALDIAARLKNAEKLKECEAVVGDVNSTKSGSDPTDLSSALTKLQLEYRLGKPAVLAAHAEENARFLETERNLWTAKAFWKTAAICHRRSGDSDSERAVGIEAAECWVKKAETAPTQMSVASCYKRAYKAYRDLPGFDDRRDELKRLLRAAQGKMTKEFGMILRCLAMSEEIESVRRHFANMPAEEVLAELAYLATSPSRALLEQELREVAEISPLTMFIRARAVDRMGRTVAMKPSAFENEVAALEHEVHSEASFRRADIVVNHVEPTRRQILFHHSAGLEAFQALVTLNPFVPTRRVRTFMRGLHAGLQADFMVATALLVPHVEESLRHLLRQKGVISTGLNTSGIKDERSLIMLLENENFRPQLIEMLGEDMVCDLQGLLALGSGDNLRNKFGHGLMSDEDFYSYRAVYAWWLVLRVCFLWKDAAEGRSDREEQT
ncbi:MAG: DUF4209 domain-containing protein [Rhodothermales bacterium]